MKNDLVPVISSEIKMHISLLVYLLIRELEHHRKGSNKVPAVYILTVSLCQGLPGGTVQHLVWLAQKLPTMDK